MTEEQKTDWWKMAKRGLIAMVILACATGGCTWINQKLKLEDDHIGEELVERIIENEVGVDIDLSPSSPER